MKYEKGYCEKIDDQFSIHIAEDNEEDLKAIIKLNVEVHREEIIETFIRRVFSDYPLKDKILFLYIKDLNQGKLVSSLCLVPFEWCIGGINLPICEMEFVGTLEEYRGRGFIKILNELFEKVMLQNGYLLSVIRGIPFYYRSLGYEYVSSLDERIIIPMSKIPKKVDKNLKIRKADVKDLAFIESNYNLFHENYYIYNKFNPACFKFKFMNDKFDSEVRSSYIVENAGVKTNYFSLGLSYDNQTYEINSPNLNEKESIILLQFTISLGNYDENKDLILCTSEVSPLYNYIISLGGQPFYSYAWQIKMPYIDKFFSHIKTLLEFRLKNSMFDGLTKIVRISDYQKTFELNFERGILTNIDVKLEYSNPQITDLRVPGSLLIKLLLGDRTINEINYIIKDAIVHPSSRSLIETLFPKKISLLSSYI
ncbi:MAG: GNAT family N-acetyltransferase [Candidatus Thorarchaeota archaeon]